MYAWFHLCTHYLSMCIMSVCLSVCRSGRLSALVVSCRTVKPQSRSSRKGVYAHIYIYMMSICMSIYIYILYVYIYTYISVQKLDFRRCGDKALLLHVKIIYNQKKKEESSESSHPLPPKKKKTPKCWCFSCRGGFFNWIWGKTPLSPPVWSLSQAGFESVKLNSKGPVVSFGMRNLLPVTVASKGVFV